MTEAISRLAARGKQAESQLRRQAERYFDEMAANFHGIYFSILEFVFNRIWPRLFHGLEYCGLEKVAERVKQHPVVLVPCHRSHFDYVILSYLFHLNYLSPPHIAAGINLSFWPLGPLFRGAGAYFIRRSFEGNELYKVGVPQLPHLPHSRGVHAGVLHRGRTEPDGKDPHSEAGDAVGDRRRVHRSGVRRDLYLVPVSIHYGRVVEEEAYQRELGGAEKQKESLSGFCVPRRVLRRRHGTVYMTFAEPISLNQALGTRKRALPPGRGRGRRSREAALRSEARVSATARGERRFRRGRDVGVGHGAAQPAAPRLSPSAISCAGRNALVALPASSRSAAHRLARAQRRAEFRENLSFLENGGLIQRLSRRRRERRSIHVPTREADGARFLQEQHDPLLFAAGAALRRLVARSARRGS